MAVEGAESTAEGSSAEIRRALDHLNFASRLLHGDEHLTLEELFTSSNAAQGSASTSMPSGGLSEALATLVSPLLSPYGSTGQLQTYSTAGTVNLGAQNSQPTDLFGARRATFQPRELLAMASELSTRLATAGQARAALVTAQKLELADRTRQQEGMADKSGSSLTRLTSAHSARLLDARKRRRRNLDPMQGETSAFAVWHDEPEALDGGEGSGKAFGDRHAVRTIANNGDYIFPGQDCVPMLAESIASEEQHQKTEHAISPSERLTAVLSAWRQKLSTVDAEAAASLSVSITWLDVCRARLRFDLDQVGSVMLWTGEPTVAQGELHGVEDTVIRMHKVNILAEAEVHRPGHIIAPSSRKSEALQEDARFSAPSTFPLYRQLTAQLLGKVLSIQPGDTHQARIALLSTLFAIAGLCHLHDPFAPFALRSGQPARGTAALLGALANWSTEQHHLGQKNGESIIDPQQAPSSPPPSGTWESAAPDRISEHSHDSSALFGEETDV